MQANLVLFYEEKNYLEVAEIAREIARKFNFALCQIEGITLLSNYCSMQEITKNLTSNTIICVGACEKECLQNIYSALRNFYGTEPVKTNYGLICSANNKFCSVVDLVAGIKNLDRENLLLLYNLDNLFYFSLYGIGQLEFRDRLKNLENLQDFEYSYCFEYNICYLTFSPQNTTNDREVDDFKRNFNIEFSDCIYCDEPLSLEECVEDLMPLRHAKFALIDATELSFLDQFQEMQNLQNFVQFLPNDAISSIVDFESAKKILDAFCLEFLVFATQIDNKISVMICDNNDIHIFDFSTSNNAEYDKKCLKNLILHKIFVKLRKNALFFS